ncbi:sorting nexin-8-like [Styela clava]
MAELSGSVPPYYRDVYDTLCPGQNDKITREVLTQVLLKSGLEKSTLSQIWDCIGCKDGVVTRSVLYKALALVAFAQQGKTVNEKLLENFSGQELPKPQLGSIQEIKSSLSQKNKSPTLLQMDFCQICAVDKIEVLKAPEKKGIFLKHVEYEVKSTRFNSTVLRRYNDFVAFYEMLQMRFPYRMLPKLPPKKVIGADKSFIEARRKSLRRFLTIVCSHPAMYQDPIIRFFLTFSGSEVVHKIKDQFRGCADEFQMSPLSNEAKDLVPADTQMQFASTKDQIKQVTNHVLAMREMATRITDRSKGNAFDFHGFGKELVALGADTAVLSSWATGGNNHLQVLKQTFRGLSGEFNAISEKLVLQATREEEGLVDQLNLLYDLLQAYHDLCDRHERGVLREHHSALRKYGAMKNKRMAATINNSEQGAIDKIESKIVAQENEILTQENRNYYSLHCIHLETQLVHTYLQILGEVVTMLVATQVKGHREMCELWESLTPRVSALLSETSPPTSPRPVSPGGSY